MSKAKRLIISTLGLVIFCIFLTSCDPGIGTFGNIYPIDGVIKIELIKYDNPDQKDFATWVLDQSDKLKDYDLSKETLLETLDESRHEQFFDQLSQYDLLDKYYAYDSPNMMCIKMTYDDGDFVIINCCEGFCGYIGRYTSSGEVKSFYGCFSAKAYFDRLVEQYFDFQTSL